MIEMLVMILCAHVCYWIKDRDPKKENYLEFLHGNCRDDRDCFVVYW